MNGFHDRVMEYALPYKKESEELKHKLMEHKSQYNHMQKINEILELDSQRKEKIHKVRFLHIYINIDHDLTVCIFFFNMFSKTTLHYRLKLKVCN